MIITFFLNFIYALILFVVNLLPVGSLDSSISAGVLYFWGVLNSFSYIFPVATLIEALGVILIFDVSMLLWHLLTWVLKKLPTVN